MRFRFLIPSGFVLFLLVVFPMAGCVEAPDIAWSKTYGGKGFETAYSLVVTGDGGFALAGETSEIGSFETGNYDFWLVRTDAYGNMLWNRTYGGPANEFARSLVVTYDGGFAIAGITKSRSWRKRDFWLVRTDAHGNMLWNQTYGGVNDDYAYSLVVTGDGGFALAGETESFGAGGGDLWLVRTDAYGNMLWNRTYGGRGYESAYSLVEASDGGFAIAGCTGSFGAGGGDFWLVKTDAYGNMLWNQTYGGVNDDYAYSLVVTGDGGFAIAGITRSYVFGSSDIWVVRTDAHGNMLWNQTYRGGGYDLAYSLVVTGDGGFAIAVNKKSSFLGFSDVWLVRTDSYGNMLWNQTYGGANADQAYSLIVTSDGGFAFAGLTGSFGAGNSDFWLVKTGPVIVKSPSKPFPTIAFIATAAITTLTAATATAILLHHRKTSRRQTKP